MAGRVQNGTGAGSAGARVGCNARDRPVFSGEDNATLCGASELQNGRRKGPAGKESADESDENFAASQCLLSLTVLVASETASLAANVCVAPAADVGEKRFGFTSRHATLPREASSIRRRPLPALIVRNSDF